MFPDFFRDDVFRLETPRLWLRWPTAADASAIEKYAGEAQVAQWTAHIPHPYPAGLAQRFVISARQANVEGRALHMALAQRTRPQALIGMVSLDKTDDSAVLGYWLGSPYWGAGLMAEAVRDLISMVWMTTGVEKVVADVMVGNARSREVLAACGFAPVEGVGCAAPARGGQVAADRFELVRTPRGARRTIAARDRAACAP